MGQEIPRCGSPRLMAAIQDLAENLKDFTHLSKMFILQSEVLRRNQEKHLQLPHPQGNYPQKGCNSW